jgi:hypothetical protein
MNTNDQKGKEEEAASVLKEVNQKAVQSSVDDALPNDEQPSTEEAAEQIKGSDADVDKNVGFDDQPSADQSAEEKKGSDADKDKSN